MPNCQLPGPLVDQFRRSPIHPVLVEMGRAASQLDFLGTPEFQKLVAYLLELADGRDRREPWTQQAGVARPIPRLRTVIETCFGRYGDLQWFRINKLANGSGRPLLGLFPRMAASVARIAPEDFGELIAALSSESPDTELLQLLHSHGGKFPGAGLELFSRLSYAFRPDLYFVIPREWGQASGCLKFIGNDQRKYCAVCRRLREVCNDLQIDKDIRGSVFMHVLNQSHTSGELVERLNQAIGPSLARFTLLTPNDAYSPGLQDDFIGAPLDFAARAIRSRRGERSLRNELLKLYDGQCVVSGDCPRDLLEVAYIVPFPKGELHDPDNAILLRSDLHTLWDLNLIGIDPADVTIHVSEKIADSPYWAFHGQPLIERNEPPQLTTAILRERWDIFGDEQIAAIPIPEPEPLIEEEEEAETEDLIEADAEDQVAEETVQEEEVADQVDDVDEADEVDEVDRIDDIDDEVEDLEAAQDDVDEDAGVEDADAEDVLEVGEEEADDALPVIEIEVAGEQQVKSE